ncbi:MAG: LysR family transcriptional regulator [Pseudomonadales bacterium]|nr:LysR family transcriptional regulator [Pseudomonadales bacterium]NRA16497.1 LysR family transcriptional regulator [Oceanospirillaceae bacterium]
MNWDDLKYFLMVARTGSIRAAAIALEVNHATVSRRINNFEASLGQRLFDRSHKGYSKTVMGDEIYQDACHLEERLNSVHRRIAGKDKNLSGDIRVTMPDLLAQDLLMPWFAQFCQQHPEINLEIIDSTKNFNLANREADVAFRLCREPPEHLIGRKLGVLHRACYISETLKLKMLDSHWLAEQSWIGWNDKFRKPIGKIAREYPRLGSKHKIISAGIQASACRQGMGIAILPCLMGDQDPGLVRIPPYTTEAKHHLWILRHPDLRHSAKIQAFVTFMSDKVRNNTDIIEGNNYSKHFDVLAPT